MIHVDPSYPQVTNSYPHISPILRSKWARENSSISIVFQHSADKLQHILEVPWSQELTSTGQRTWATLHCWWRLNEVGSCTLLQLWWVTLCTINIHKWSWNTMTLCAQSCWASLRNPLVFFLTLQATAKRCVCWSKQQPMWIAAPWRAPLLCTRPVAMALGTSPSCCWQRRRASTTLGTPVPSSLPVLKVTWTWWSFCCGTTKATISWVPWLLRWRPWRTLSWWSRCCGWCGSAGKRMTRSWWLEPLPD